MVSVKGIDEFSIEALSKNDLSTINRVIESAPLPDKRVLFKLHKEIKQVLTNA